MTMSHRTRAADELVWTGLIAAASVLFSFAFACATPFAAIAAVAATQMDRRAGLATVLLAWVGNQAIGFGLLHYPNDASTYEWGAAIGISATLALVAARAAGGGLKGLAAPVAALTAAFVTFEGLLYATSLLLGSGSGAFAPVIVARIAAINAVALAGLILLHRGCLLIGVPVPRPRALSS